MQKTEVLINAIRAGIALLTWEQDGFAYAENYDESAARYRGLRSSAQVSVTGDDAGLLVRPEIARGQIDRELTPPVPIPENRRTSQLVHGAEAPVDPLPPIPSSKPKRYHGTVSLDSERVGRDAGRIAEEVITHLTGLIGSSVRVTLEIEAEIPGGAPDNVVRTVTENSRTLKFNSSGFESE